jgi:hypothetical protein
LIYLIIASACAVLASASASPPVAAGEQPSWLNGIFNNSSTPRPPKSVPSNTAATTTKTNPKTNHRPIVLSHATHERTQASELRTEKTAIDSSKTATGNPKTAADTSKHVAARPNASAFPPVAPLE